jgi:hypothetical protein
MCDPPRGRSESNAARGRWPRTRPSPFRRGCAEPATFPQTTVNVRFTPAHSQRAPVTRKGPHPEPTWPMQTLSVAHDLPSHRYVRLDHMSLLETIVLSSLYAIVLAAFLGAVYQCTIRPFRKAVTAKPPTLQVPSLAGRAVKTIPDRTPLSSPACALSRTSRTPWREVDPDARDRSERATTPIQSTTEVLANLESLPTFSEVWATKTATQSFGTTRARTLTVKELPTRMLSPVLLPVENDLLPEGLRTFVDGSARPSPP